MVAGLKRRHFGMVDLAAQTAFNNDSVRSFKVTKTRSRASEQLRQRMATHALLFELDGRHQLAAHVRIQ